MDPAQERTHQKTERPPNLTKPAPVPCRPALLPALLLLLFTVASQPAWGAGNDLWYCVELFGAPAGWMRDTFPAGGADRVVELDVHLTRMGTAVDMWSLSRFTDAPQPLWTTLTSNAPGETTRVECRPREAELEVRQTLGETVITRSLPRPHDLVYPHRLEALYASTLEKRESELTFSLFSPELIAVPRFRSRAELREEIVLPTGQTASCTRWRVTSAASPGLTSLEWRDDHGVLRRIEYPALQMNAVECPTEAAREASESGGAELMLATMLATEFDFGPVRGTKAPTFESVVYRVRYPVTHRGLRAAQTPSTVVERTEPGQARVTVRRLDPAGGSSVEPETSESGFSREDALRATTLLQADHPLIRETAARVAGGLEGPWERARALCTFVYEDIRAKNLAVAFGSALQTLRTGQGDCTEHAVLLAALCRAQGVPSRLVAGLIGMGQQMGYHLWTEVMIENQWIGLDGAFGRAPTDGRYLAIATTDLRDDSTAPLIYGILDVLGTVSVEVAESSVTR